MFRVNKSHNRLSVKTIYCFYIIISSIMFWFPFPIHSATATTIAPSPENAVSLSKDVDVGVVFPFAAIELQPELTNTGSRPVRIEKIVPRWEGTEAKIDFVPATVPPGGTYHLGLIIQNEERVGRFSHIFLLFDGNSDEPVGKIAVRGFTDWIVDPKSLILDVGVVSDGKSIERIVRPQVRPGELVRFKKVSKEGTGLEVAIVEDGRALRVKSFPRKTWGPFEALILVDTDNPIQNRVGIRVKGEVRGAIVPSMNVVEFGVVRVGEPSEKAIRLEDAKKKKINIAKIDVEGAAARVKTEDCIPNVDWCRVIKLRLDEKQMVRAPHGVISIHFPDYEAVLPIPFGAAIIGKDTVVRDLAQEIEASRSSSAALSSVLKSSVASSAPLEMAVPGGEGPLLKWEMTNESTIFGYEVYRSIKAEGPFARVNSEIIPRLSDDSAISSVYRWRDSDVKSGTDYWYYIGVVYQNGRKESLSSAQKIKAK